MRKLFLLVAGLVLIIAGVVLAQQAVPKIQIDSTPAESVLINFNKWFAEHPLKPGEQKRIDPVYASPRCVINSFQHPGAVIGKHMHTSSDEIMVLIQGEGEMFINGKWVSVKAPSIHVNPRGMVHTSRAAKGKVMRSILIYVPPMEGGNDRVMVND